MYMKKSHLILVKHNPPQGIGFLPSPADHLGFGIEFNQPAIIAEALAQSAVTEDWIGMLYLLPAQNSAKETSKHRKKNLVQNLNEVRADRKLA
jgi:hypothetical protein